MEIGWFGNVGLLLCFLGLVIRVARWFLVVVLRWLLLVFICCAFRMFVACFWFCMLLGVLGFLG